MITPDPSDSSAQRAIETIMLRQLEEQHPDWHAVSWKTTASTFGLSVSWQKAEPDAVWETDSGEIIVAESYARIGDLKPSHRRKLAMDAFKLQTIRQILPKTENVRCLIIVPEEIAACLQGDSWFCEALRLTAEIVPISLHEHEKKTLKDATALQAQGQARTNRPMKDATND